MFDISYIVVFIQQNIVGKMSVFKKDWIDVSVSENYARLGGRLSQKSLRF